MRDTELATIKEESRQLDHMKTSRLDDSLFSKELAPHYMKLAGQLASSELVPKSFRGKPQDLFICWAMGYQVGLTPEQSMQCIAVINGKPAMWGDDMLALCMTHKDFMDIEEEPILKDGAIIGYTCTVTRKGRHPKSNPFTLDMAKRAGLLAKGGVWAQYPERMLKLRARGFTLRDAFPDALKGIKSREEVEDYIDAEYKITESSGSRTEQLKKDYLTKTGKLNDKRTEKSVADVENIAVAEEVVTEEVPVQVANNSEEIAHLYSEVRRILAERGIANEGLAKLLKYYEVDSLEELDIEKCKNFIHRYGK